MVRVDILHALSNEDGLPWRDVLERARQRITLADELGIDGFWLGEHHFDHMGIDQSPNPVMLMADLARRTARIRIGIAAVILPAWHPVRLAEDLAMLDHMTDGRLDVAFSRGILQAEIINLNAEADRKNDEVSKAIFAERLDMVRAAWTEHPFSWKSERFTFPHPDTKWPGAAEEYTGPDGRITGLAIIPQPAQPGGPPLYTVTDTPSGFGAAAHQGLNVITWFPTRSVLDDLNATFRAEKEVAGPAAEGLEDACAILRGCLIAPTDAEARALVEQEVRENVDFITKVRGLGIWLDKGEDADDPAVRDAEPFDLLFDRDHLMIGSPETVAEKMIAISRERGIRHWLLSPYLNEADEHVERTLRLLADEVLPRVRAALG
ncbi:LLM class flavin-dependent oxidoreductase [Pimelobacter simplex]|uniref:LLM class flavin-dependent oxidoreductase n=1 Tax=Nocardioides simplex TaxID=2045 RepID=UPI00214FD597|nr:LLM class flavin-dependent oxidoreductase [Pimelobacter simplex]UUW91443.1 LLM class flavin-dependent oxidoreductase [Pimelobacter simplex]UUW95271.1 LLM class flavin-dependent oxidoreductase [Pimelobacter simplex]